ncbi:hypothetical protein JCM19297_1693 [Nonlabens ulvanivorans]|nr:hypothetical protein JCM19297_1693 [Nonlabens ulvanivorans]
MELLVKIISTFAKACLKLRFIKSEPKLAFFYIDYWVISSGQSVL